MEREEAIKILDPRTYEKTIAKYESFGGYTGAQAKALAVLAACEVAVSALHSQQSSAELGRSQGDRCEYCAEYADAEECAMLSHDEHDSDRGMYIFNGILISNSGEFQERKINFCPICGRSLNDRSEG